MNIPKTFVRFLRKWFLSGIGFLVPVIELHEAQEMQNTRESHPILDTFVFIVNNAHAPEEPTTEVSRFRLASITTTGFGTPSANLRDYPF